MGINIMKFKKLRKIISFNDSIILDITDKNGNSSLLSYANILGVPNKFNKYKVNVIRTNKTVAFGNSVPKVHLFIAGWNSDTNSTMTINGGTIENNSITADSGISGTGTTYTLTGTISGYYRVISVNSNTTSITIQLGAGKRAVVWGVNAE